MQINGLVLSLPEYSAVILVAIDQTLIKTLEKQLNWAVNACFYKREFDSSAEVKAKYGILPITVILDNRISTYCKQINSHEKPAFKSEKGLCLPKSEFYYHI